MKKRKTLEKTGMIMTAKRNAVLRALGHTLLIIGLVLCATGVHAQEYEGGKLQMSKSYIPTSPDNTEGDLWLETYVTGAHITKSIAVPSDIVLVLDMSYSMRDAFSSSDPTPRVQALHDAVASFLTTIFDNDIEGAGQNGVMGHRVSIVAFSSQDATTLYSITGNTPSYGNVSDAQCRTSLCEITSNNQINSVLATTAVNRIVSNNTNIGTYAQYGLNLAYRVLSTRTVTTYFDDENVEHDRGVSVVFFTDGYVGGANTPDYFYIPRRTSSTSYNQAAEADAAVYQANRIKGITGVLDNTKRPVVFSVGIYPGADPHAPYTTTYSNSTGGGNNGYVGYYSNRDDAANGLMHMISSDYDYVSGMTQPTYSTAGYFRNNTTSNDNVAERFFYTDDEGVEHTSKFFKAENQDGLNAIFTSIAQEAGTPPIEMSEQTMVQDVVSSSFTLPQHDGDFDINDIEVYAVKCTYAEVDDEGNVHNCQFVTEGGDAYGYGTKTSYNGNEILYLDLIDNPGGDDNCAVDETTAAGKENRLRSSQIVQINTDEEGNPKINITGFNFKAMYCGEVVEGGVTTYVGRKLVIKIPIHVKEGIWGDDFNTNGEMSFVQPGGSETIYPFERPITNVMGSVWTEVVTTPPTDFDPMNIDSPEDLAWFVSCVNGRIHYLEHNNVASNPTLSGKLTADIDMSAHNWVPIGAGYKCNDQDQYLDANGEVTEDPTKLVKLAYQGTFDGNGYVITGLKNNANKFYKVIEGEDYQVVVFPGMFANVKGTVKNVVVLGTDFRARNHSGERETFIHFGIIADTLSSGGHIFNCEAVGRITCNNEAANISRDSEMIFGGLVGYNNGGEIHSSMAMPTLTGYTMGGMIGQNEGSFTNGFTNGVFNYLDNDITGKYVGGIAGTNTSSISNCYVRFSRSSSKLDKVNFGQVVGNGSFTEASCYTPRNNDEEHELVGGNTAWNTTIPTNGASSNKYSNTRHPGHMRGDCSNDNMVGGSWVQGDGMQVLQGGTSLLTKLNNGRGSGSEWKRTTAGGYITSPNGGDINGDYPVLKFSDFTCLAGNNDGIGIDYASSLDEMLDRHNNYTVNTNSSWNNNKYKNTKLNILKGGAINLFANETTSKGTSAVAGTVVYIDENVSLLQSTSADIEAYTGQTIIDYGSGYDLQSGNRWHNVSSSLQNSKFGLTYTIQTQVPSSLNPTDWDEYVAQYQEAEHYTLLPENPCRVRANSINDDEAIFPTDMRTYNPFDLYCFYELKYHWINFKRNSASHWHMNAPEMQIEYNNEFGEGNETQFIPGKGYLLALHFEYFANWHVWSGDNNWNGQGKDRTFLQNRGILNNGEVTIPVTYTSENEWTNLAGYNLIGNPYQSYLDFNAFANATENASLWEGSKFAKTYAVFDPSDMSNVGARGGSYSQYMANSSKGSRAAGQYLNMHQGFFIQVAQNGNATFTNNMRIKDVNGVNLRGEQPAFPLINFIVTDSEGNTDLAILEVNRDENDGAKKLRMGNATGRIFFRYDDEKLAIFFRDNAEGSQSLHFTAEEDGNFTLNWERANDNFSSLTLIDNITGVKTDMLTHDHYTFEGNTNDYTSRFKIVFGTVNNEEEDGSSTGSETFAFFNDGSLIVNGEGRLDVIDVLGRIVYSAELTDTQNTVNLPVNAKGVCMLRLTNGDNVKVQKMFVR